MCWHRRWLWGVAVIALAVACPAFAREPDDVHPVFGEPGIGVIDDLNEGVAERKIAPLWLGVRCAPAIPEALRNQLGLRENRGVLVIDVAPDSPAAAAQIRPHDVLIEADGQLLRNFSDLIDAIRASEPDEPLELEVIRGGQEIELKVSLQPRPETLTLQRALPAPPSTGVPPHVRFLEPTITIQAAPAPLPDDVKVTISRQGKQPAKITVERGAESWSTTEDQLDKLPEAIRPYAQTMLRGAMPFARALPQGGMIQSFGVPGVGAHIRIESLESQAKDQMRQHLQRLLAEEKRLLADLGPDHPRVKALRAAIEGLERATANAEPDKSSAEKKPPEKSESKKKKSEHAQPENIERAVDQILQRMEAMQDRLEALEKQLRQHAADRKRKS